MKIHSFAQLSKPSHWCSLCCVVCCVQDAAGRMMDGPVLKSQNTSWKTKTEASPSNMVSMYYF